MYIQQLYTNCLAQAAYYIEDNGEAAIIDPLRDVEQYINLLDSNKTSLKYIFETHFHADFVSGHIDLSKQTGAHIVFGPNAKPEYMAHIAADGEKFRIGNCTIELLHTPGHTVESSCFLLYDENNLPHALFTGDTVFVGDVGRPDLLSGNLSKEVLAEMLYESIHTKIMPLRDDLILYPGHGAGSACGKNLGKETFSTIGEQKQKNYALQPMSKQEFVKAVIADQPLPPAYFFKDAAINKKGYEPIDKILHKELHLLQPSDMLNAVNSNVTILDVRTADYFADKHIKKAINIGLDGTYAIWAGTILPVQTKLIIVCPFHKASEAITRLARVGFENIMGYWDRDLDELEEAGIKMEQIKRVDPIQLHEVFSSNEGVLLDVRNTAEFDKMHIKDAVSNPLNCIQEWVGTLDLHKSYFLICAGGYRSMIAASIMQQNGIKNVINVNGGMTLAKSVIPELVVETQCMA